MGVTNANVAIVDRFLCNVGYDVEDARIGLAVTVLLHPKWTLGIIMSQKPKISSLRIRDSTAQLMIFLQ
jgi:hypothetical protein